MTGLACLEKNLQNAAPNIAHIKQPEAPIRESMAANPAKDSVVWYTGSMYRDIAVIA